VRYRSHLFGSESRSFENEVMWTSGVISGLFYDTDLGQLRSERN